MYELQSSPHRFYYEIQFEVHVTNVQTWLEIQTFVFVFLFHT